MKTQSRPLLLIALLGLLLIAAALLAANPAVAQDPARADPSLLAPTANANDNSSLQAQDAAATLPPDWEYACADCPYAVYGINTHNLRVDGQGRLHVAFGNFALYHAVLDGGDWQVETVDDQMPRGEFSSLALDAGGNPHILYREYYAGTIYYAYKDAEGWHRETLHQAPYDPSDINRFTTIEVDGQNRPHALFRSYTSESIQPLIHGRREGGVWHFETIDANGVMGLQSALAFDNQGYPHISYADSSTEGIAKIRYAYQDAAGWHYELVEDAITGNTRGESALVLAADGQPVIAYNWTDGNAATIRLARRQSDGTWVKEDVFADSPSGLVPALVLDAAGYPHLVHAGHMGAYWGSAIHTYQDGTGWHSAQVEPVSFNAYATSLARDTGGNLYLFNVADTGGGGEYPLARLLHATLEVGSSTWITGTLGQQAQVGVENSLVLDSGGRPHLASFDQLNLSISYAYWDGAAWQSEVVDTDAYWGFLGQPNPALALDAGEGVHIAYYKDSGLAYGYRDAAGWHTENVPGVGVEDHSSEALAMAPDGTPRIAHSLDNNSLAYSYRDGTGWHTDILTTTGAAHVDLVLDDDGYAHISYLSGGVWYAHQDASGWHLEKVNTSLAAASVYGTSLALDADGNPHIASGNGKVGNDYPIAYSYKEGGTWHSIEVQHNGGAYPSLALDSQGYPHLVYPTSLYQGYPEYKCDLRYAYQDRHGWHYQSLLALHPMWAYYPYTDIALDSQDRPYLSFLRYNTLALVSRTGPPDTEPPTLPANPLLKPADGEIVYSPQPWFDWADATDTYGVVSYTLLLTAEQAGPTVYRRTATQSAYFPGWELSNGSYAWTVRAYDAAGNASAWAAPYSFTVDAGRQALNVKRMGQAGGATYAVAVRGNYAYVGVGPRLVVLDISDPAQPTIAGRTEAMPGLVQGVAVDAGGRLAYVAAGSAGLRVVDVSNPASPVEIGACDTTDSALDVAVADGPAGPIAYVAADWDGLLIIDVSNPAAPTQISVYTSINGPADRVTVLDNYAYIAGSFVLEIIDISNASAPTLASSFNSYPGQAYDVAVISTLGAQEAGDLPAKIAYVANGDAGLRMLDVSDAAAPTAIGVCDTPGTAYGVVVSGSLAYVADLSSGLRILDVADPAAAVEVGSYDTPGNAYSLAVDGTSSHAYVADGSSGLRVVDVSNQAAPAEVGSFVSAPTSPSGVALPSGSTQGAATNNSGRTYAYITDQANGLRILDISNPAAPTEAGSYDTPGRATSVVVASGPGGLYAYVTDDESGLRIIDVSDPAAPAEVGSYDTPGRAWDLTVTNGPGGRYAYIADWNGGLRIVDVTNPAAPTEIGSYVSAGYPYYTGVAVAAGPGGTYAYAADVLYGLRVLDVTNPAAPTEVGFLAGTIHGVVVRGELVYVAAKADGLLIVDVSDATAPAEIGSFDTSEYGWALRVEVVAGATDTYAYVTDSETGLHVVDVSDPAAPTRTGFYQTSDSAGDVALMAGPGGTYACVTDGSGGLLILRYPANRVFLPLVVRNTP
jgi:hypothetical protein